MIEAGDESFVPRSQGELDILVTEKPDYWEYRLFAGALILGAAALDTKYEDYLLGYAPRRGVAVYEPEFVDFLKMQLDELRIIGDSFTRLFSTESDHAVRAFGAPGVAGDAGRILHLAQRYVGVYEELLLWAERLRGTSVPSKYHDLMAILARFSEQPVGEIRRFIVAYAERVSDIPREIENASTLPILIEHELKWTIPDQLMAEYHREFERIIELG